MTVDTARLHDAALADCVAAFCEFIVPPAHVGVPEWSDAHRELAPPSPRPGRWSTAFTPFCREIMERLSPDDPCETVAVMKCVQIAITEVALNWLGQTIHVDPCAFLYVLPTVELARRFSRTRVAPMIQHSPPLKARMGPAKSRGGTNNTLEKDFPGGFFRVTGANSAAGLQMDSFRRLVLDEVDNYPTDVDGQGDPLEMALGRTTAYEKNRKILIMSKATVDGKSRVQTAFKEGDQRYYYVPCPHCGAPQQLVWSQLKWPAGNPTQAFYVCIENGCIIESWQKDPMLADGEWRATAPYNGRVHSYHLNALYAPAGFISWATLAAEWLDCAADPVRMKRFVNERLGECWSDEYVHRRDHELFLPRLEDYGPTPDSPSRPYCPSSVVLLTCAVDVQRTWLDCQIAGWGAGGERWVIDRAKLEGDTRDAGAPVWAALDAYRARVWTHDRYPQGLRLAATVVDSSWNTDVVYEYTDRRASQRVWAIKGKPGERVPIWPEEPSVSQKNGRSKFYSVGVWQGKDDVVARLHRDTPGPGYMHFPRRICDEAYFKQLTAEKLVDRTVNGVRKRLWVNTSKGRNEVLDLTVYDYAALLGYAKSKRLTAHQVIDRARISAEGELALYEEQRSQAKRPAPKRMAPPPDSDWLGPIGDFWR